MPKKTAKKRQRRTAARTSVAGEPYVPTDQEFAALSVVVDRIKAAPPHARTKAEARADTNLLSWDHPSQPVAAALWANALGTGDLAFAGIVFEQLAQLSSAGSQISEKELNGLLSLVRGLAPSDPTEALLVTQMAAVHQACMVAARRLTQAQTREQQDSHAITLTRFSRTFTAQVEALKRYRSGGEQTIKVQHVTVNEGGQAIVGNVQTAPGGSLENERQSHELGPPHAPGPALLGTLQAHGQPVPSPRGQGQARVPVPRRTRRRTEGQGQRRLPARAPHM